MTDLFYRLASAIATKEGYFTLNALPKRNHNPGNLRSAPWLGTRPTNDGFVVFASPSEGIGGLYHQIALDVARGATLRTLISKWAPPDENDTAAYITYVTNKVGINPDIPLNSYLEIDRLP